MTATTHQHKALVVICLLLVAAVGFVIFQALVVVYNGTNVPTPDIPREPIVMGEGKPLNYVVMGDSTSVAQGAEYVEGYAVATAQHLAETNKVTMVNVGVSGARAKDMEGQQLNDAVGYKPDVVLLAVGGNDVTHLTSSSSLESSIKTAVSRLVAANCDVKIIMTGVPQMGSVSRFPQPLRVLAGLRTTQLNRVFDGLASSQNVTFARIAEQTGQQFKEDPSLFAQDKFHPNARGYATWIPVLNHAIDDALTNQPTHCPVD